MRSISSAEAAQNFDSLCESVLTPGAESVAVTHANIPRVVVISFKDYHDLLRKTRFAGKLEDLPEDDLAFLATIDERNRCAASRRWKT
ncbi:type II toxin-antitoxin system Phd/YefM family antitoxin [Roseomonas stagni]|uniref:Type II toxin-antitoxin system Phd/YefM family antitoxin n=1 Tax=Falsiroseomonas algicola TaxID=2716930 RepID=A0A6M1LTU9_9PROT|nr:type II toxin-antitoxin system Phd/YefM family antitoxin [Falsiroseomonas algicola]NGM23861.1 type II toxin-antitoxin system Phd/YefM family antitoxin [Falsiroseomonas algicola]